jgi:hypothetical protein
MKKIIPELISMILLTCFISAEGYSQDWIKPFNHDTLSCKIARITKDAVYFDINTNGIRTSGKILKTNIAGYHIAGEEELPFSDQAIIPTYKRITLVLNGGYGYLLGSTSKAINSMTSVGFTRDQANAYYNDLKSGFFVAGELYYNLNSRLSIGLTDKFFMNSAAATNAQEDPYNMTIIYYSSSEKIYVNYSGLAVSFYQQYGKRGRLRLNSSLSVGVTSYRDEAVYTNTYVLITGICPGTDLSVGMEYRINDLISLNAGISSYISYLKKVKVTDGTNTTEITLEKGNTENLSRLDLSAGIRFYFLKR